MKGEIMEGFARLEKRIEDLEARFNTEPSIDGETMEKWFMLLDTKVDFVRRLGRSMTEKEWDDYFLEIKRTLSIVEGVALKSMEQK